MKKTALIVLLLLTAWSSFSQDASEKDSITLSFDTGKAIALQLVDYDRVRALEKVNALQLSKYENLVKDLQAVIGNKDLQIELLEKINHSLQVQLDATKDKSGFLKTIQSIAIGLGLFATGFLVGSL